MDITITEHAKHRLRQRRISIKQIKESFNRYFYLFENMKEGDKRKMLLKSGKKYTNAIIGKKEKEFFLVTVFSEKYTLRG